MKTGAFLAVGVMVGCLLTGVYYWSGDAKPALASGDSANTAKHVNKRPLSLHGFNSPLRSGSGAGMSRRNTSSETALKRTEALTADSNNALKALEARKGEKFYKRKRLFH